MRFAGTHEEGNLLELLAVPTQKVLFTFDAWCREKLKTDPLADRTTELTCII